VIAGYAPFDGDESLAGYAPFDGDESLAVSSTYVLSYVGSL